MGDNGPISFDRAGFSVLALASVGDAIVYALCAVIGNECWVPNWAMCGLNAIRWAEDRAWRQFNAGDDE